MSFATFHDERSAFFNAKFYANSFMPLDGCFFFFCDLLNLVDRKKKNNHLMYIYPAVHFLSMWFSGIRNSRGDSASPRKIPLWIFVSAKLFPPTVNSTLQFFMFFSMKFMISCETVYYPALRNHIICIL